MDAKTIIITDTVGTGGSMRVPAATRDDALARMFPGEVVDELMAGETIYIEPVTDADMTEADWRAWWLHVQETSPTRTATILNATVRSVPASGPSMALAVLDHEGCPVTYRGQERTTRPVATWLDLVAAVQVVIDEIDGADAMQRLARATRDHQHATRDAATARRAQHDAILAARSTGVTYADLAKASGLSRAQLDRIVNDRNY